MTDEDQQRIIRLREPSALVLAGPGCGKTYILARRVFDAALRQGVPLENMLCLTFTNRAAREMKDRVEQLFGRVPGGLFVGNLHRFCLRFLFANRLIAPDTSVVDDEDFETFAAESGIRTRAGAHEYFAHGLSELFQEERGHLVKLHGRSYNYSDDDILALEEYRRYKRENHLIDYDDILLLAYDALLDAEPGSLRMTGYSWIQVDEVQDLSPVQLAIIKLIKSQDASALYLGDERQAIFGFTGAGRDVLENIRRDCRGHIFHLHRNYRSPRQLVDLCNDFAYRHLDIDPQLLPVSVRGDGMPDCLQIYQGPKFRLVQMARALACRRLAESPGETCAILVHTNREALQMSEALEEKNIGHIVLTQNDIFHEVPYKTIWCHLAVGQRPERRGEWSRLLYQTGAAKTLGGARRMVARMTELGICPDAMLDIDSPTDVERLLDLWSDYGRTVAVLDTETTGLDVFTDDVVQISAVKYRGGRRVEGSEFNIFLRTDKPIPAMLDDVPNPLAATYAKARKFDAAKGLGFFAEYMAGCIPAGHNLTFDLTVLRHNYLRRSSRGAPAWTLRDSGRIDTLRLSRLLYPRLWSHRLGEMIAYLGLEGVNSHDAADDCDATGKLLSALAEAAAPRLPYHRRFRTSDDVRKVAARFRKAYAEAYADLRASLDNSEPGADNTLSAAIRAAHGYFTERGIIEEIQHFGYVVGLIDKLVVDSAAEHTLRAQLDAHLAELLSFNEGDLFAQGVVRERLIVLTIHKAKGMEMDNVIVFDGSGGFGAGEETMRVLYVAMSRARQRLAIGFSGSPERKLGELARRFRTIPPDEQMILLMD